MGTSRNIHFFLPTRLAVLMALVVFSGGVGEAWGCDQACIAAQDAEALWHQLEQRQLQAEAANRGTGGKACTAGACPAAQAVVGNSTSATKGVIAEADRVRAISLNRDARLEWQASSLPQSSPIAPSDQRIYQTLFPTDPVTGPRNQGRSIELAKQIQNPELQRNALARLEYQRLADDAEKISKDYRRALATSLEMSDTLDKRQAAIGSLPVSAGTLPSSRSPASVKDSLAPNQLAGELKDRKGAAISGLNPKTESPIDSFGLSSGVEKVGIENKDAKSEAEKDGAVKAKAAEAFTSASAALVLTPGAKIPDDKKSGEVSKGDQLLMFAIRNSIPNNQPTSVQPERDLNEGFGLDLSRTQQGAVESSHPEGSIFKRVHTKIRAQSKRLHLEKS